jgi:hypothetical protein
LIVDSSWISPVLVAAGIAYSIWRDSQRDAKREATHEAVQKQHSDWLKSHSKKIADAQVSLSEHGQRISALEALRDFGHGD